MNSLLRHFLFSRAKSVDVPDIIVPAWAAALVIAGFLALVGALILLRP
jgi:uncharacterized membrane protein